MTGTGSGKFRFGWIQHMFGLLGQKASEMMPWLRAGATGALYTAHCEKLIVGQQYHLTFTVDASISTLLYCDGEDMGCAYNYDANEDRGYFADVIGAYCYDDTDPGDQASGSFDGDLSEIRV